MEYIFGRDNNTGEEVLKTKGESHTDLKGFVQTVRETDLDTTTDNFLVVCKTHSAEDDEGNCYDWYIIDKHNTIVDTTKRVKEQQAQDRADIEYIAMETGVDLNV